MNLKDLGPDRQKQAVKLKDKLDDAESQAEDLRKEAEVMEEVAEEHRDALRAIMECDCYSIGIECRGHSAT